MTSAQYRKHLEEILKQYKRLYIEADNITSDQALLAILTLNEEAIGEDEHKWLEATPSQRTVAESLNYLRNELRTIIGKGK